MKRESTFGENGELKKKKILISEGSINVGELKMVQKQLPALISLYRR
jgi:hypothetical protein